MKATLLLKTRHMLAASRFLDIVIWQVPQPVLGSSHGYKYRLAYVANGECVLRYDNEAGKGDHKHINGVEVLYTFVDTETLVDDFWNDVTQLETQQ
jgi:hypothetical protein